MTYQSQAAGGFALAPALGVMFLYPNAIANPGACAPALWEIYVHLSPSAVGSFMPSCTRW